MQKIKSYLRDSQSLITLLKDVTVTDQLFLGTCDVSSFYTCIPHELGIQAIENCLKDDRNMHEEQRKFVIQCLRYCLTRNDFWYGKKFYNQSTGTAMGTIFAPSYANLFMQSWEEDYLYSDQNPYSSRHLLLYRRYIDDCFITWNDTRELFANFMDFINQNPYNLKCVLVLLGEYFSNVPGFYFPAGPSNISEPTGALDYTNYILCFTCAEIF